MPICRARPQQLSWTPIRRRAASIKAAILPFSYAAATFRELPLQPSTPLSHSYRQHLYQDGQEAHYGLDFTAMAPRAATPFSRAAAAATRARMRRRRRRRARRRHRRRIIARSQRASPIKAPVPESHGMPLGALVAASAERRSTVLASAAAAPALLAAPS